jgi:hypothetical protein
VRYKSARGALVIFIVKSAAGGYIDQ